MTDTTYRGYRIYFDPPPIPIRTCDWHYVHEDYDGGYYDAEGAACEADPRCGSEASEQACRDAIDWLEDEVLAEPESAQDIVRDMLSRSVEAGR